MVERKPPSDSVDAATPEPVRSATLWQIGFLISFTFVCYFCGGLPLATIPGFVHGELGYGVVIAGAAISIQYLATVIGRIYAGKLCDSRGPRLSVCLGLALCSASGIFMVLAGQDFGAVGANLACLAMARILIGISASLVTVGVVVWALGIGGPQTTARILSWNGIGSYLGLALGAPIGVWLTQGYGWSSVGWATFGIGLGCVALARRRPPTAPVPGERLGFAKVLAKVAPFGLCLALGSVGFGAITAFVTLHFASHQWQNAALALTLLGVSFIVSRLFMGPAVARYGGYSVTLWSFAGQVGSLTLLWLAPTQGLALVAIAITGFCSSMVFPALGVEVIRQVTESNRGAAFGSFTLFFDLALFLAGPSAGVIATRYGYDSIFLGCAVCALLGWAHTWSLRRSRTRLG